MTIKPHKLLGFMMIGLSFIFIGIILQINHDFSAPNWLWTIGYVTALTVFMASASAGVALLLE